MGNNLAHSGVNNKCVKRHAWYSMNISIPLVKYINKYKYCENSVQYIELYAIFLYLEFY